VLRQAGAERAGAVLLLSADSTITFEAALQVRPLNPTAEIVVRSTSRLADLDALLEHRLPGWRWWIRSFYVLSRRPVGGSGDGGQPAQHRTG
jgi:hypothetical protein